MQKKELLTLALALLGLTSSAKAQTDCPPPTLKVLCNNQEVPPTGAPLVAHPTLLISPGADCPGAVRYEFTAVEMTLTRGPRPMMPTRTMRPSAINMLDFARTYDTGDRLYVFVPYRNLVVVAADGTKHPYPPPAPKTTNAGIDLSTDQQKGIGFNWLLIRK